MPASQCKTDTPLLRQVFRPVATRSMFDSNEPNVTLFPSSTMSASQHFALHFLPRTNSNSTSPSTRMALPHADGCLTNFFDFDDSTPLFREGYTLLVAPESTVIATTSYADSTLFTAFCHDAPTSLNLNVSNRLPARFALGETVHFCSTCPHGTNFLVSVCDDFAALVISVHRFRLRVSESVVSFQGNLQNLSTRSAPVLLRPLS